MSTTHNNTDTSVVNDGLAAERAVVVDPPPTFANYAEFYTQRDFAATRFELGAFNQTFATSGEEVFPGAILHEKIQRTADEMPHAYALLIRGSEKILLLHRTHSFPAALGQAPRDWEDKVIMFDSDVVSVAGSPPQLPSAVYLPARALNVCDMAKVHKWATYLMAANGFQPDDPLDAVPNDAPESQYDLVVIRKAVFVPPPLVGAFMCGLTVSEAIVAVDTFLNESAPAENVDNYWQLKNWLRVMKTPTTRESINASYAGAPERVRNDPTIVKKLLRSVNNDLPGWAPSAAPSNPATEQAGSVEERLANIIASLVTDKSNSGGDTSALRDTEANTIGPKQKDPGEFFSHLKRRSEKLFGLGNEFSSPVWKALVNADKKTQCQVLQDACDERARVLKYARRHSRTLYFHHEGAVRIRFC